MTHNKATRTGDTSSPVPHGDDTGWQNVPLDPTRRRNIATAQGQLLQLLAKIIVARIKGSGKRPQPSEPPESRILP